MRGAAYLACKTCARHFADNAPAILHAASSAGIEHGLTTEQAIESYYRDFHRTDHQSRAASAGTGGKQ